MHEYEKTWNPRHTVKLSHRDEFCTSNSYSYESNLFRVHVHLSELPLTRTRAALVSMWTLHISMPWISSFLILVHSDLHQNGYLFVSLSVYPQSDLPKPALQFLRFAQPYILDCAWWTFFWLPILIKNAIRSTTYRFRLCSNIKITFNSERNWDTMANHDNRTMVLLNILSQIVQ